MAKKTQAKKEELPRRVNATLFAILTNANNKNTRQGHDKMKKAFTLIELVFVIIVIGILAAAVIPRMKSTHLSESVVKLISNIRYTQHLAIINDVYSSTDADWYKKKWSIDIQNSSYSIKSGLTYAIDPITRKPIKDIEMKNVTTVLSGGCKDETTISFDNMGRPFVGEPSSFSSPVSDVLTNPCIITLTSDDDAEKVTIFNETGYAKIN